MHRNCLNLLLSIVAKISVTYTPEKITIAKLKKYTTVYLAQYYY